MAGPSIWNSLKSVLRKNNDSLFLNDCNAFDFSDEIGEEDFPRFKKLQVVVSDDAADTSANGAYVGPHSDDESLLDRDIALRNTVVGPPTDPCNNCTQQRERLKQKKVKRRLVLAAILYLLFMTGELVGGYVANSLAVMTDALHMLTDLSSIILTLLALWLSGKAPTKMFTFGFHRLDRLAAQVADLMGFLLSQSGHLHSHSHTPSSVSPPGSSTTAPGHSHGHGHGHGSLAVRAAFVHALGDLVQSIGVLVAAYIIRFKPEYKIADPICTYVFSVLVAFTTFRIIRDTGIIVLEGVPRHLNVDLIREELMKIEDVFSVENLYVWSLTSGKTIAIVHLQLVPGSSPKWEEVQSKARQLLLTTFGVYQCSIQLQSYRRQENKPCANCQSA
ncbi:putative Solute carrier family 30 member 4 protein [Naja naja]|nr:putative Solute carrier family 30 member 4 protein [Naja naja]